jgi:hypothetical protein
MESDISKEELDTFLQETGIVAKSLENNPQKEKEGSLEKLLEEIMVSAHPPSLSALEEKSTLPLNEKTRRLKFPLLPLLLSIAFLGGTFLGTVFGFYWGTTQRGESQAFSMEEIDSKIDLIAKQIQEIYDKITPTTSSEEIIEPLQNPQGLEKLAPKRVM